MHLRLIENGSAESIVVSASVRQALDRASRKWRTELRLPELPLTISDHTTGQSLISARGVAGFVRVGEVTIDILPKFLVREGSERDWLPSMWRFLSYAEGLELTDSKVGLNYSSKDGIADLLADVFIRSTKSANVLGYPVGFQKRKERTEFLRGKLDLSRVSVFVPYSGKLPVVSSRLTRDVTATRLLKWAAKRLAVLVERSSRRKILLSWVADLNDVAELHDSRISVQSVSRQHPHLSPALEIAQLLLADASGNFGSSSHEVSGFLWNSDDIFESAMRRLVSEVVRPIGLVASKRGHRLLKNENFTPPRFSSTFPDIDVYSGKKSRLILDAKYKVFERMPSSGDAYQIIAAGRVAGVSTVGLIYPGIGATLEAEEVVPLGDGLPERIILIRIGLSAFSTRPRLNELKRIFRKEIEKWLTYQPTGPALPA